MQALAQRLAENSAVAGGNRLLQAVQNKLMNWDNRTFFDHPFLNKESDDYGVDNYFKAVSHHVDLSKIYKVLDACYYNESNRMLPVLIEISEQEIRDFMGGYRYLLQLWQRLPTSKKLASIPLHNPTKKWAICEDGDVQICIYTVQEGDENSDCLHLAKRGEDDKINIIKFRGIGVSDEVTSFLYHENKFFEVKGQLLSIYTIPDELLEDSETIHEGADLEKKEYDVGAKVHDIILYTHWPLILIETKDNQIDFSFIYLGEDAVEKSGQDIDFVLVQAALKAKRNESIDEYYQGNDPIIKVIHKLVLPDKEKTENTDYLVSFAVALRQSGDLDFYEKMTLLQSGGVRKINGVDLSGNFGKCYITVKQKKEEFKENNSWVPEELMESIEGDSENILAAFQVSFQQGYFGHTYCGCVSDKQEYQNYKQASQEVAKEVVSLFNGAVMRKQTRTASFTHNRFISIYDLQTEEWSTHYEFESSVVKMFEAHVGYSDSDEICVQLENNKILRLNFPSEEDRKTKWIPEITEVLDLSEKYKIVQVEVEPVQKHPMIMLLLNKETNMIHLDYLEKYDTQPKNYKTFSLDYYKEQSYTMKTISQEKEVFMILQKLDLEDEEGGSNILVYQVVNKNGEVKWDTLHNLEDVEIYKKIHSIAGRNPNRRFMLIDDVNSYIITPAPFKLVKLERTFVKQLFNYASLDIHYAIVKNPDSDYCDLKYFDISATVQNQKASLLPLYNYSPSANKQIMMGLGETRFGFFQSYSEYLISIFPNRNYNCLYNETGLSTYRFYKQIKDRVIINDYTKNKLFTYDVVTAKLLHVFDSNIKDIDEYERFNPRGDKSTIFYKKQPEDTQWDIKDFYPAHMADTITLNQLNFRQSQCPTTLHKFRELEIKAENNIEIILEFSYPYQQYGSFNLSLVTNQDKTHLIARDDMGVFLYRIVKVNGYHSKLELVRQITEFTPELQVYYRYRMDMFTPNFSKFIVFDPVGTNNGRYMICNTFQNDGSQTQIPYDIMYLDNNDKKKLQTPQQIISKMQWIDESKLRVINDQNGVEKIFDVDDNFKELAFNQIPLFQELSRPEWEEEYHIILSRKPEADPIKKLQKLYQEMKSLYYLFPTSSKSDFYQLMMKQDYEIFDHVSHSFTLMSWKIADSLRWNDLKITDLSEKIILQILYSIYPGGDTILHLLSGSDEFFNILEFCHPQAKTIKHHMPFLPNNEGKTVLHLLVEAKQTKAINTLLKHLALYGADHHSKAIKDVLPELVELKLADFDNYLESRFIQSEDHIKIDKYKINFDSVGFTTSSSWISGELFSDCFNDYNCPERKVKVETLDIAGIYHYNDPHEDKFFDALANTDQFSYFELRSIQCLIDFNYKLVQKYLIRKLFVPFIVFHFFYLFTIFTVFESRYYEGWNIAYYIMLGINAVFASYFLANEVRQIAGDGLNYFKSFWNYIDLIPVFGIYAIGVFSIIDSFVHASNPDERVSGTIQRIVVAIVTLFMWLKFLYFFRIFDKTSYLIRAVVEVVKTMRHFFLVLLFTIIAFGNAFLVLALGNETDEGKFITGYVDSLLFSYRMVLGDFDTGAFGDTAVPLVWIMFLIFTVFNIIVMLNLLIAVISDAYAAVAEQSEQAMYQERASMIAENNYLIPEQVRKTYAQEGQLLLVVTDLEDENRPTGNDAIIQKVEEVRSYLEKELEAIESQNTQQNTDVKAKLIEMKTFLLKTLPQEKVLTKIHPHKLVKMTYLQENILYENELTSWSCQGKKFNKCHSAKASYPKTDEEEEIFYCSQCSFTMCIDCQDNYNDIHCHPMEKLKYSEVKQRDSNFQEGWTCSCSNFKGCPRKDNAEANDFDILYHDGEEGFDLCPKCVEQHQIVA